MFRKAQLIFAVALMGCTTVANDTIPATEEEAVEEAVTDANTGDDIDFLDEIDATLETADDVLDRIVESKLNNERKITILERDHSTDIQLIEQLKAQCDAKDSVINEQLIAQDMLQRRLEFIEKKFEAATHRCNAECTPAIHQLTQEKIQLQSYIDSLHVELSYVDSLLQTNKKLTRVYETTRGSF